MAEGAIDFPENPGYLFAAKSAATLAISLLDRAFSHLDGGNKKAGYKEKLLQNLRSIQADLDEAVRRQIVEDADRWVPDFIYVVEETEGAIDEIDYRRLEEEVRNPISKSAKAKIVNKAARFVIPNRNLRRLRKAVHRLDVFASELSGLCQHLVAHGAPDNDVISPAPQLEHYPSWIATEGVFLRVKEKEQIVKWLIKNPAEGPEIVSADHISIFAILGIAGMGKTTLAKLVRQDPRVSTNFDFVAFVPVSDDFTAEAITAVILQSITDISPAYYNIKFLQHTLTDKKLLLILDDVWEDNSVHKWEALMALLRGCKRGSKILLTTRMQSVADMAAAAIGAATEYLKLDDLDEDDNFMLFKSRLPSHSHIDSEGYADLLLIGEQIAKRIGGCPLVTIIVASWLGSHLEIHHWEAVLQKGWKHTGPIKDIIVTSLRFSYDHLPTQLQICFRYCGIFPKGYKFNKVELANMWICSGLIPFTSSKPEDIDLQKVKDADSSSAEDVSEQYFDALARKSFFCCMLETEPSNGDQKEYYVLHSLMHDLAQLVSQGECARVDYGCDFKGVMETTQHLYLAHCPRSILQNMYCFRFLRTLIIQSGFCLDQQTENVLAEVLRQLKCLRLLYLAVPSLFDALDSVSSLINLRYLFLFSCHESHLHKVFKLYHLQVFKLNYFTVKEGDLDDIHNLRYLRCLHVPENMSSKIHQIGRLTSLQELHGFEVVDSGDHRLSALSNLRSLRQLSLRNLQNIRDYNEAMEVKLKEKHDMRFLSLSWNKHMNDPESLDNQTIDNLEPNKELQRLRIHGYHGVILPFWIANSVLINLVSLELEYCMKWKSLPSLQELNSLKYLKLEHLFQLEHIGTVLDEQFAANKSENACLPPFLNTLIVRWCPSLKKLPAIPCTLEQLIIKHVGLAVLPRICQRYTGRCESSSSAAAAGKSYLAFLHIESCAHLTSLDEGFLEQQEHLQALTTLAVRHCERLRILPTKGFTELHHLNFLDIVACPMLRDAWTEGSLLPITVKSLDINPCGDIEVSILMSLQNLTSLKRLTLFNCSNIEELPSVEVFGTLNNLNDMSVVRCKNVLSLGGLGAVASLKVLSILCCEKLNFSYSPQAGCSFKLHKLKIDRQALLLVEPLRSLRHTNELHICDDYAMESLPEEWLLQNGTSLRSIEIGVAESLRSLPSQLAKLGSLQSLHIERAPLIQSLPQLPASLSKLTIWGCDPMLLKRYEKDTGLDWGRIARIADVDMKAYSEGMNYSDDQIQDFDNSTSNPCRQFVVID